MFSIKKLLLLVAVSFVASSCATQKETQASQVRLKLSVKHPPVHEQVLVNHKIQAFVDNDGNQYVTYWKVADTEEAMDAFSEVKKQCIERFKRAPHLDLVTPISELQENDLKPKNFITVVSCMKHYGYQMAKSEAFYPESFTFNISKSHTKRGEFMPVGVTYILNNKGKVYADVMGDLMECSKSASKEGAPEIRYYDNWVYTSIENYAESMTTCLASLNYAVEERVPKKDESK